MADVTAFTMIGSTVRTTNAQEMSGDDGKIGPLWHQYMHGGAEAIPGAIDRDTTYAVYSGYANDETGPYDLTLGKSVHPEEQAPAGMRSIRIPAARYLVFTTAGNSPDAIRTAWRNVYDYLAHHSEQHRAFTIDFEQYSPSGVKLFIAVRQRERRG